MENVIVALMIFFIISLAIGKIVIDKRKGVKCAGCPLSGECSSHKAAKNKMPAQRIEIKELV
jgi:hypothetical protein